MNGRGVAFTAPADGDMRSDQGARRRVSDHLGIDARWATVEQVHGAEVVEVTRGGPHGQADGMVATVPGLAAAVFTADCLGVVLHGRGVVGVAHAGWRGLAAGVLESTMERMEELGARPDHAALGPAIGPCCFEVGAEVAELFPDDLSVTTGGRVSVDLVGAALRRLPGLEAAVNRRCTACEGGPSHRSEGTHRRLAAIGWMS